jgi:hypothetical protein
MKGPMLHLGPTSTPMPSMPRPAQQQIGEMRRKNGPVARSAGPRCRGSTNNSLIELYVFVHLSYLNRYFKPKYHISLPFSLLKRFPS